jgi:glycosyltransferase involved in cell wall biosynthesis
MSDGALKIGVNAGVLDGHPTGIGNFTKNIIQHLSMLTNDLRVWVTDYRFIQRPNIATSEFLTFMPRRMRGMSIPRSLWDQLVFPCTARAARVDVVFFPIQEGMLFPSVPQVVFVHDLGPLLFPDGVPVLRRFSYQTRIPLVLKHSAAVAVPTETVRRELLSLYPFVDGSKVHVIGEGYDDTHFQELEHPRRIVQGKYILFVGNNCQNKNLERMIEAFSRIDSRGCRLVIVGKTRDHGYASKLRKMVVDASLSDSVLFFNYLPYDELPHLYSAAELFVFPSLYEGFGLPILEAMACGTPVITSNCSAMPEVAGDAALLVDPYDIEDIASAIHEVLCNSQKATELRRAGLERVKQFSWLYAAQRLYNVCKLAADA